MSRLLRRRIALVLASLAALTAVALASATSHSVARTRAGVFPGTPPSFASFTEVFARGTKVGFCTLETGQVYIPRSGMLRRDATEKDPANEHTPFPIYAHLVRHPARGDMLVDAGLDASFVSDQLGNFRLGARAVHWLMGARFELAPGDDLGSQLARRGASPWAVFFTHVHGDHTAGVPALPPSTRLVAGAGERDDVAAYVGYGHVAEGGAVEEIDAHTARPLGPFERVVDLLGDGSLLAIATPGHSRGHTSYLVNATTGPVLLVGDASHSAWAFDRGIGPRGPTASDDARAQQSLDALRTFVATHTSVRVVFGHEARDRICDLATH